MATKDEALKLALEALENSIDLVEEDYANAVNLYGKYPSRAKRLIGMETMRDDHRKAITALREALAEQPAQQEPVAFLANGTRFKISYDSRQSGGQIHGIPPELGGRWVAFVAADDDCHLKLTSPPAHQNIRNATLEEIATKIEAMPFGDTAASFAVWIREQKN